MAPSHYISYRSTLTNGAYTWTGLFLHRLPYFPGLGLFGWRLPEEGELVLILYSDSADMVEIGLNDEGGGEHKIVLRVQPAWAGYRIELRTFRNVHMAGVDQLILAHSRTVGSASENTFRIAAVVVR